MNFCHLLTYCCILSLASSQVLNITTEETFNSTIANHKYVMVKFYAPWCAHCKTMIPEYHNLAENLKDNDVIVAEVDATELTNVSERFQIRGFPTIKFFVDGTALDYQGPRTAENMYEWIKKVTETQLPSITQEEVASMKSSKYFVVYYGNDPVTIQKLQLLTISDSPNHYFYMKNQQQRLVLYRKTQQPLEFSQEQPLSIENIKQWVMLNTLDTIIPLSTKQHLQYVFYDQKTLRDVALLLKENDLSDQVIQKIQKICQANKLKIKCCLVDNTMQIYGGVKSYVRSRGKSVLTYTKDTLKQAYTYPHSLAQLTQLSWSQFVQQITENKHKNIASAQNDQLYYENVKTLVTENYTTFINQNDAVLVQYVTPGCAKCSEFAQNFDLLAKEIYQDTSLKVEVAVIDMRKNMEVAAQLQIMEFPSFRLHLAGAHIQYKGVNAKKDLLAFVLTKVNLKPISVRSIAEVPTSSVIIYDPAEVSRLTHLPAIFTRYQVYHLQQGNSVKIVLRHDGEENTLSNNQLNLNLSQVSSWLYRETDPVLVNMLMTNVEGRLRDALKSQVHLLGLIDVEAELSASLTKTMEEYCKKNVEIVCGYAKKRQENFEELMTWAGIDKDITKSELIYVNTTSFDNFILAQNIEQLNLEKLQQFVSNVKEGKIAKHTISEGKEKNQNVQTTEQVKSPSSQEQL